MIDMDFLSRYNPYVLPVVITVLFACDVLLLDNLTLCVACRHIAVTLAMGRHEVVSLQRQCCSRICRCGVAITEYAIHQLPVHMGPALLVAAVRSQQNDVVSCIVSNWPLPVLRYVHTQTPTPSCMCTQLGTQFKPGTLPNRGQSPSAYSNECPHW